MLTLKDGRQLVKLARKAVENYLEKDELVLEKSDDKKLDEKRGVFVTIDTYPEKELRGCIGFPSAEFPLRESVQRAACSAAFQDPRFESLNKEELDKVTFEVSVMTKPELIKLKEPAECFKKIKRGKDGLILTYGVFSGLFLPQVWEQIPTIENFLKSLCSKAGLPNHLWKDKNTKLFKFRVQAFKETKPNGRIVEVKFD